MAIQGTITYVNPSKQSEKTGKWSQSIKVATPNNGEVYIYGVSGSFDTYQKGAAIMIEQDGQYWKLAKDQTIPTPGAPMSATQPTLGQVMAGTPVPPANTKEAMIAWGEQCTDLYLHILNKVTLSPEFAAIDFTLQKEAAATVYIAAVRRFERP